MTTTQTTKPAKTVGAYAIIKATLDAIDRVGAPRPDEKLKQIVGAQIRGLLRGGYDAERIRHFAVELALSWDNARGHQRLLSLRQVVLEDANVAEQRAHEQRVREANETPVAPEVARAVLDAINPFPRRPRPDAWVVPCGRSKCPRTALYGKPTCAEHAS